MAWVENGGFGLPGGGAGGGRGRTRTAEAVILGSGKLLFPFRDGNWDWPVATLSSRQVREMGREKEKEFCARYLR